MKERWQLTPNPHLFLLEKLMWWNPCRHYYDDIDRLRVETILEKKIVFDSGVHIMRRLSRSS